MTEISIGIIGAGAIGSYVGGFIKLASPEIKVVLIGRSSLIENVQSNENKIRLSADVVPRQKQLLGNGAILGCVVKKDYEKLGNIEELIVTDNYEFLKTCDVIIIAVKTVHSEDVLTKLKSVGVKNGTLILSFQNGVGNKKLVSKYFPKCITLPTILRFNIVWNRDSNTFLRANDGCTQILKHDSEIYRKFVIILRKANFNVEEYEAEEMTTALYTKLCINLSNAVNALHGANLVQTLVQRRWRQIRAALTLEAYEVCTAAGVKLGNQRFWDTKYTLPLFSQFPDFIAQVIVDKVYGFNPNATGSMLQDVLNNRKTEISYLNGKIVELADQIGRSELAKYNRKIVELVLRQEKADKFFMTGEEVAQFIGLL